MRPSTTTLLQWRNSQAYIREVADNARLHFSKNPGAPVDVEFIAEVGLRLEIHLVSNLKRDHDIEGSLSKDGKVIYIDRDAYTNELFERRMRFTIAHELGHYFLHRELFSNIHFASESEWINYMNNQDDARSRRMEWQANEFAGRLLVPRDLLIAEIAELREEMVSLEYSMREVGFVDPHQIRSFQVEQLAHDLAPKFNISEQAMEIRINRENII